MQEKVRLKIDGNLYDIKKGATLEELAPSFQGSHKYPIILAKVNNYIHDLTYQVDEEAEVTFLDLTSQEGSRAHIGGLTFLIVYAIKKLYGEEYNVTVEHSLDKGIYFETNFELSTQVLTQIKNKVLETIKLNLPITKLTIERLNAIEYFDSISDKSKVGTMKYNTNTFITLYQLDDRYNYFYTLMPTSTSKLKDFDFTFINKRGFILRFPTPYIKDEIKEYQNHPLMFDVFRECREWAKIMNIENSVDLNKIVSLGKINDLIRIDETLQSNRLLSIAGDISSKKDKVKIVLMAGPSSSGKTTTSKKLSMYLQSYGLTIKMISMDDYFVDRKDNPVDENGEPDYECLEALDLKLFDEQMAALLNKQEVKVPTYNFNLGVKEYKRTMKLEDNEMLLIEGIHALDDKVLSNITRSNKYKIYISPLTELNIDDHNRVPTTDNRLLRRIIRDNRTRNYKVEHTLEVWSSVRRGEEKYIFPFQDDVDVMFNSALIYEIGVLKTYVEPLLYSVEPDSKYYEEAKRLINFLRNFLPIPSDAIAQDSILREFIGNGCYED